MDLLHKEDNLAQSLAGSLYAKRRSLIFPEADGKEAMLRYAEAQILKAYLIMSEIMFSEIASIYIKKSADLIKEHGLYKQLVKKSTNELCAVQEEMRRVAVDSDSNMVRVFCCAIFPKYVEPYVTEGGSLVENLQLMFYRTFMNEIKCIEFNTKNVFDLIHARESEIGAALSMILLVAHTVIEMREALSSRVARIIPGYKGMTSLLQAQNERLLSATKKLMDSVRLWDIEFPEKEGLAARQMAADFQKKLLKQDMLDRVQAVIKQTMMDFTEYTIAQLKRDLMDGNGKLPFGHYRVLLMRLGTHDNVVRLLKEIYALPEPEDESMETMDYKLDLPDSVPGTALAHFRRLCVEDKIMVADKHDLSSVKARSLRVKAERSGGVLPVGELKALYKQLGTKKAVAEALRKIGPEMAPTITLLQKTKVAMLKAA